MTAKTILIVDDDPGLRQQIALYLTDNGLNVLTAGNGAEMDAMLARASVDLIILDVGMPGEDGLSICRRLNRVNGPGIIMASAAGEETDRVLGLELGADDYLPKPFSPRELLARTRALLRRREALDQQIRRGETYEFSGFTYDPARRQLKSPKGASILLTSGEASLLNLMLSRPGEAVSRDELCAVAGDAMSRGADIAVSRLRKKLEAHGGAELVQTKRGVGYSLAGRVTRQ